MGEEFLFEGVAADGSEQPVYPDGRIEGLSLRAGTRETSAGCGPNSGANSRWPSTLVLVVLLERFRFDRSRSRFLSLTAAVPVGPRHRVRAGRAALAACRANPAKAEPL